MDVRHRVEVVRCQAGEIVVRKGLVHREDQRDEQLLGVWLGERSQR